MSSDPNSASKSIPSISSFQYASYPPSNSNSNFPLPFHLQQNPNPYIQPPPLKLPPQAYPPVVSGVYFLPQFQQAQQLFQRDAQTITPEALESVKAALASNEIEHKADTKKKAIPRKAAGQTWEDPTLAEWPRVVRDKRTGKTRGFGFVSFANSSDLAAAIKEMNGKYVGNRPIKLRKCNWKERTGVEALERQKNLAQKKPKMAKKGILHK